MIRLRMDAFTLERCKCGQHPRILAVADLIAAWRKRDRR